MELNQEAESKSSETQCGRVGTPPQVTIISNQCIGYLLSATQLGIAAFVVTALYTICHLLGYFPSIWVWLVVGIASLLLGHPLLICHYCHSLRRFIDKVGRDYSDIVTFFSFVVFMTAYFASGGHILVVSLASYLFNVVISVTKLVGKPADIRAVGEYIMFQYVVIIFDLTIQKQKWVEGFIATVPILLAIVTMYLNPDELYKDLLSMIEYLGPDAIYKELLYMTEVIKTNMDPKAFYRDLLSLIKGIKTIISSFNTLIGPTDTTIVTGPTSPISPGVHPRLNWSAASCLNLQRLWWSSQPVSFVHFFVGLFALVGAAYMGMRLQLERVDRIHQDNFTLLLLVGSLLMNLWMGHELKFFDGKRRQSRSPTLGAPPQPQEKKHDSASEELKKMKATWEIERSELFSELQKAKILIQLYRNQMHNFDNPNFISYPEEN